MQLYDGLGNASASPRWISCSGNDFTLFIQSPDNIDGYTIDWGDGSPEESGSGITPPAFIQHTYTAAVDSFIVTLTDTVNNCAISGVVIMEEPVNASIQIPVGGVTATCAPATLDFINSSTNVSPSTTFTWDFGDGSPVQTFSYANGGQTVSHTYNRGTVNCQTQVTLTAQNYCSGGFPTIASFNPVQIWDIDDAQITASATLLCYPDTVVRFQNTTNKNCVPQGNTFQRYEYWNFGNYWGTGHDSIINWQPYDPPARPGYFIGFPGIGSYTVMLIDSNYCGLDTAFITVNIVPPPTAALASNTDTVCAGDPVTFTNLSTGGANAYSWNFGDGSGWINTGGGAQSHSFNNAGDYQVQLAVRINGGTASCTDTVSIFIHVLPRPVANFTLSNNQGCDSLTVSLSNTSVNAVSWQWNFGNGNNSSLENPPPQFYGSPGTYNITLTVVGQNGCDHSRTRPVNIYQTPVAIFTPLNACEDEIATFFDNSSSAPNDPVINWAWNFDDGGFSSLQNPTHVFQNTGVYDVVLTATTAHCSGTDTTAVTVSLKPLAAFATTPDSGCSPLPVNFTNQSAGADTYMWAFGDGATSTLTSPSHTYSNTGNANQVFNASLIVQTNAGCRDTAVLPVKVFPNPVAAFTSNANPSCAPMPVTFTNTSAGAVSYQWDFGDNSGSTNTNPFHLYQNQTLFIQNYTVSLVATSVNGCTDTVTTQVTTYPEPQFGFNTNPDSGCSPLTVTFPSVVGAVLYQWDFGDGSTGTGPTPTHTYVNATTNNVVFPVTLIATNPFGCIDTSYGQVTVNPNPNAQFTMSSGNGCQPQIVTFQNNSTGGSTFNWNFGDGNTSVSNASQVTHVFTHGLSSPQTYSTTLTVTTSAGCVDTARRSVTVYPKVNAIIISDTVGCSPLSISFSNTSQGASSFSWDFDDGATSNVSQPSHAFVNNTNADLTFDVKMVAASAFGCSDTVIRKILVHPKPNAQYTVGSGDGCQPVNAVFNNTSTPGMSYSWSFGDGDTTGTSAASLSHTYQHNNPAPQLYQSSLIVTSQHGCTDTAFSQVTVYPKVYAAFTSDTSGCAPLPVQFSNQSQGAATFDWSFDDGSTGQTTSPSHTFANTGTTDQQYNISLIATSAFNCSDTAYSLITVHPSPVAAFIASPGSQVFPQSTVTLDNTSNPGTWNYLWNFGDTTTSSLQEPGSHVYNTWGDFMISLITYSQYCSDTAIRTITIIPPVPIAAFTGRKSGCKPVTVNFSNRSVYGTSYLWEFGDGSTSNLEDPVYTYSEPGIYSIRLTVTGPGGTASVYHLDSVSVFETPDAHFTYNPKTVYIPNQAVIFYNLSENADTYEWDFGDGSTSSEESPQHYYTATGEYNVTLIATTTDGCVDTFAIAPAVIAEEDGGIIVPNAFTPNQNGPNGGVIVPGNFDNDVFHPLSTGVTKYRLSIFNRWGELIFESTDINIGWDGYYRDKLCEQDVYIWKIEAQFSEGKRTIKTGDVLLLR